VDGILLETVVLIRIFKKSVSWSA